MRFKVDENLPGEVVRELQQAGHDALSVLDQGLRGTADRALAQVCRDEGRILVTLDLDFADIRAFRPSDHAGLVVLRLARQDVDHVLSVVQRLLGVLAEESPAGRLWLVDESRVRVRE